MYHIATWSEYGSEIGEKYTSYIYSTYLNYHIIQKKSSHQSTVYAIFSEQISFTNMHLMPNLFDSVFQIKAYL